MRVLGSWQTHKIGQQLRPKHLRPPSFSQLVGGSSRLSDSVFSSGFVKRRSERWPAVKRISPVNWKLKHKDPAEWDLRYNTLENMKKHYYHLQWDVTNSDPELYGEGKSQSQWESKVSGDVHLVSWSKVSPWTYSVSRALTGDKWLKYWDSNTRNI